MGSTILMERDKVVTSTHCRYHVMYSAHVINSVANAGYVNCSFNCHKRVYLEVRSSAICQHAQLPTNRLMEPNKHLADGKFSVNTTTTNMLVSNRIDSCQSCIYMYHNMHMVNGIDCKKFKS